MLAGLDEIPWSQLKHAYGDAGDIPDLIRAVTSSDPHERAWAQDMLGMGAFHQGSLYSCTPFVVRFLLQIVQERDAPDKPWILQYVSRVLASARYLLADSDDVPDSGDSASDSDTASAEQVVSGFPPHRVQLMRLFAEQVVSEIRPHLLQLTRFFEDPDVHVRLSLLRLLVLMKADFPHVDTVLEEQFKVETQEEALRAALAFCLSLAADTVASPSILATLAMLEDTSASPLVRLAAGFGVLTTMKEAVPGNAVTVFCGIIADNFDALYRFEEIYQEYLAPLGAPALFGRLLECLTDGLPPLQKDQLVHALLRIYAQLPTVPLSASRTTRIGYLYYLEVMVRLAFPPGKLPPETTIRDLTDTQRAVLEAFQQYDMPSVTWNLYSSADYRTILGLNFLSETDFLDFMAGKRSAR